MTITEVTSTNSLVKAASRRTELDQNSFLQLLVTQLSGQNPFEPLSDKELFQQIATMTQVQGLNELRLTMAFSRAQGLLGHKVDYYDSSGNLQTGVVTSVLFSGKGVLLEVDGITISPDRVVQDYGVPAK